MSAHEFRNDTITHDPVTRPCDCRRGRLARAHHAVAARVSEWEADRAVDQGDTHDKGEPSLCVGEAV
jgi:hypothetical protein